MIISKSTKTNNKEKKRGKQKGGGGDGRTIETGGRGERVRRPEGRRSGGKPVDTGRLEKERQHLDERQRDK